MVDSPPRNQPVRLAEPSPDAPPARPRWLRATLVRPEAGGVVSAIIVFLFFAVEAGNGGFLTNLGTSNWLGTAAELGIVAVPISMLMIAGEYDLSIGAMVGSASTCVGIATGGYNASPWIGVLAAIGVAVIVGTINGLLVIKTGLPSFIVTLATMMMLTGTTLAVSIGTTGSSNISASSSGLAHRVFATTYHHFGVAIVWWLLLALLGGWVMSRTKFGNWAYATGGNEQSARLAGVPIARVKISLFIATSVGAAITGIVQTLSLGNANVTLGNTFIFQGIAAAVIGGVLLTGGYGSVSGSVFGVITYGVISTGVLVLGWDADLTQLFIGALLLLAVLANHRLRQLALGRR
jgi:simple sugar transport system permease protein